MRAEAKVVADKLMPKMSDLMRVRVRRGCNLRELKAEVILATLSY
jgi:hypothetical protein